MKILEHNKGLMQIKFAIMVKEYVELPWYKFYKSYKLWKDINKFAKEHKYCCEIEWKIK